MAIDIKYIGTQQRWPELPITGKQSVWMPGQEEERADAEALLLLATGLFQRSEAIGGLSAAQVAASAAGLVGDTSAALMKTRKALGEVLANIANARICAAGDSTTAGLTNAAGATRARSPAHLLGLRLRDAGFPVNLNISFCDATNLGGVSATTFDPRWVTAGTAWATVGSVATFGGRMWGNSTTTETISFAPGAAAENQFDSFELYFVQNAGYGTFTVNVDGGATLATINSAGARQVQRQIVNCALGNHTINIARNGTGGQVFIIGVVCRNSTAPKSIEIYNGGLGSATSADLLGNVGDFTYLGVLGSIAPHITILDVGINDRRLANYSSTFDANLQTIVSRALLSGDVLMCLPVASSLAATAFTTAANQAAYNAATLAVAMANGLPVYDKLDRFGTYETGNALGLYADTLHPSNAAYAMQASDLARILLNR